jgi:hypothetical protein
LNRDITELLFGMDEPVELRTEFRRGYNASVKETGLAKGEKVLCEGMIGNVSGSRGSETNGLQS